MNKSAQMNNLKNGKTKSIQAWEIIQGLLVLAIVVFIIMCGVAALINLAGPGVAAFFSSLSTLDSATVVALITATVSIVTYVSGNVASNVMKRNEYLRKHREETYMRLISIYFNYLALTKPDKKSTKKELDDLSEQFTKELILWGSSKAIKAWGNWQVATQRGFNDPKDLWFGMERVLIQLRKDMGLKWGIAKGDLLRLTIFDIDDYIGQNKRN